VDNARHVGIGLPSCGAMELRPYEYRDPGQLLAEVMAADVLSEHDLVVVLVCEPSVDQKIVRSVRFTETPPRHVDHWERSQFLRQIVEQLQVPACKLGEPPSHSVMTITARRGWPEFGPSEFSWLAGWRYSNHLAPVFVGDLLLITEHGWADFMSGRAGRLPALA
jgi:hypothetical protein